MVEDNSNSGNCLKLQAQVIVWLRLLFGLQFTFPILEDHIVAGCPEKKYIFLNQAFFGI